MKTVGIIAEYNPFHTGHEYQIAYAREKLGADFVVIAMSGDFVQRGTPALLPKHMRAEMALGCGADVVLELPVQFSSASAEFFAKGGVQLLDGLGIVDELCFGSELGETDTFMEIARILLREPASYREVLREGLKKGLTFPAARCMALTQYFRENGSSLSLTSESLSEILSSPNNILGLEYCKAILREKSSMKPVTLKRKGSGYHDDSLSENQYPSASAIRRAVLAGKPGTKAAELFPGSMIPHGAFPVFEKALANNAFLTEEDFSLLFRYRLLTETAESLVQYLDMPDSLAKRIISRRNDYTCFPDFVQLLKTKDVTQTRIQRALLHMLLEIREIPREIPYARILGFRRDSSTILSMSKKYPGSPFSQSWRTLLLFWICQPLPFWKKTPLPPICTRVCFPKRPGSLLSTNTKKTL